jgi:hypothetical protein
VTREKIAALTGNSRASAATEACQHRDQESHARQHEPAYREGTLAAKKQLCVFVIRRNSRCDDQDPEGGAERQDESRVRHRQRIGRDQHAATTASALSGRLR